MSLNSLRKKINSIDQKMVNLLNSRAQLSLSIGKAKIKSNKNIYAPEREAEILGRIKKFNKGPMSSEAIQSVYSEIMSGSIALEKKLNIAYLGMKGSYTHLASKKKFGSQISYMSCDTIVDVFQAVENGVCDYGVVPIENSIEGAVSQTFDMLVDSQLKICAQIMLKISHNLESKVNLNGIKKIYSNPQAIAQCRKWLNKVLPNVHLIPVASTSLAAQQAAKEKGAAAIASSLAADIYKLKIIKNNIQDIAHNVTRFLVLSKQDVPQTGHDRTSIMFSIKDKVGALHDMLVPFHKNKINLTKIESRPSKKRAWDYYFFVDFRGHRLDKNVKKALSQLEGMCLFLKVVGSYPVQK